MRSALRSVTVISLPCGVTSFSSFTSADICAGPPASEGCGSVVTATAPTVICPISGVSGSS